MISQCTEWNISTWFQHNTFLSKPLWSTTDSIACMIYVINCIIWGFWPNLVKLILLENWWKTETMPILHSILLLCPIICIKWEQFIKKRGIFDIENADDLTIWIFPENMSNVNLVTIGPKFIQKQNWIFKFSCSAGILMEITHSSWCLMYHCQKRP